VSYEIHKAVLPVLGSNGEGWREGWGIVAGWGTSEFATHNKKLFHEFETDSSLRESEQKSSLSKTIKWRVIFLLLAWKR